MALLSGDESSSKAVSQSNTALQRASILLGSLFVSSSTPPGLMEHFPMLWKLFMFLSDSQQSQPYMITSDMLAMLHSFLFASEKMGQQKAQRFVENPRAGSDSLKECSKRPLRKNMKVKAWLHKRPQDARETSTVGHLTRRAKGTRGSDPARRLHWLQLLESKRRGYQSHQNPADSIVSPRCWPCSSVIWCLPCWGLVLLWSHFLWLGCSILLYIGSV